MLRLLAESPGRTGVAGAVSGCGLGLHRVSHHAHGGQPHRQPARQDRADPEEPRWIKTVHGVGYKLDLPTGA